MKIESGQSSLITETDNKKLNRSESELDYQRLSKIAKGIGFFLAGAASTALTLSLPNIYTRFPVGDKLFMPQCPESNKIWDSVYSEFTPLPSTTNVFVGAAQALLIFSTAKLAYKCFSNSLRELQASSNLLSITQKLGQTKADYSYDVHLSTEKVSHFVKGVGFALMGGAILLQGEMFRYNCTYFSNPTRDTYYWRYSNPNTNIPPQGCTGQAFEEALNKGYGDYINWPQTVVAIVTAKIAYDCFSRALKEIQAT